MESSLLSTILGLAGTFLGLAIAVQIFQEMYKYITSSKSRAYTNALTDFLGPWSTLFFQPSIVSDFQMRSPFQLFKIRPKGSLLPLEKNQLIEGLEKTVPPWIKRTLDHITAESTMQKGTPSSASPQWKQFLTELGRAGTASPGYWNAHRVVQFLKEWEHTVPSSSKTKSLSIGTIKLPQVIDASRMLIAFRAHFMQHVDEVDKNFSRLQTNYEYSYRRRNTRQTFIFAILLAVGCNLPIDVLYRKAAAMSPEEAAKVAEYAMDVYQRRTTETSKEAKPESTSVYNPSESFEEAMRLVSGEANSMPVNYLLDWSEVEKMWDHGSTNGVQNILRYFFGCFITALMISFGAPFWNDLSSSLLNLQKGQKKPQPVKASEDTNG
ncbi:MAG: hypothetical protein WDA22_01470 [Bacteroidota bacterium]